MGATPDLDERVVRHSSGRGSPHGGATKSTNDTCVDTYRCIGPLVGGSTRWPILRKKSLMFQCCPVSMNYLGILCFTEPDSSTRVLPHGPKLVPFLNLEFRVCNDMDFWNTPASFYNRSPRDESKPPSPVGYFPAPSVPAPSLFKYTTCSLSRCRVFLD